MKDILIIVIPILVIAYIIILFIKNEELDKKINRTLYFIDFMKDDKKIDKEVAIILMTSLLEDDIIGKITEYAIKENDVSEK